MKWCPVTRRAFLQGAGILLPMPFLPSLRIGNAYAQASGFVRPKRLIVLFWSNGTVGDCWNPSWSNGIAPAYLNSNPGFPVYQKGSGYNSAKEVKFSEIPWITSQGFSRMFTSKFNGYWDKMLIMRGLDSYAEGAGHMARIVTSACGDNTVIPVQTIDQIIANKVYTKVPHHKSIHLGTACFSGGRQLGLGPAISRKLLGQEYVENAEIDHPLPGMNYVFNYVLKGYPNVRADLANKKKLVDQVFPEFQRLMGNNKLSSDDKNRLGGHMSFLNDMQNQIAGFQEYACTAPGSPKAVAEDHPISELTKRQYAQLDNVIAAITCGLTNIATVKLIGETDCVNYRDVIPGIDFAAATKGLDDNFDVNTPLDDVQHHDVLSHTLYRLGGTKERMAMIGRYYLDQLLYLTKALDIVENPLTGETIGDNTAIVFANSMSHGGFHDTFGLPTVIMGGKNLGIDLGRYVDYRKFNQNGGRWEVNTGGRIFPEQESLGRPFNEMLMALMSCFGATASDWETVPGSGYGDYRDPSGLFQVDRSRILPFFKKA